MTAARPDLDMLLACGSPGRVGDAEIWADEAALDGYVASRASGRTDVVGLVGAAVRFPGKRGTPAVYQVISRRWSTLNLGRPYYVLRFPD